MEVDSTDDLHGVVLNSAFKAMIANPNTVLVNTGDNLELSLNRNILILFSPLIRNILGSVPCCIIPTMYLPDITTRTIIKLRDILNKGISGDFWDVKESGDVLEAASALGIDMTRLHYGAERHPSPGGEILVNIDNIRNKSKQMKKVFDQKKMDGKEIVFISKSKVKRASHSASNNKSPDVSKDPASGNNPPAVVLPEKQTKTQVEKTQPNPTSSFSTSSRQDLGSSSLNTQSNVLIKKEAHAMEDNSNGLEDPTVQLPVNNAVNPNMTSSMTRDTEDLKNQCEKCKKAFASMTLLRYHYCSHFRGILKKKFANLFHDNKCLECAKTFPNHGRLLLHIGVQHDKINEILKSKGIAELPPYSATAAVQGGLDPPIEAEAAQHDAAEAAGDDMENLVDQTNAFSTSDVKNIPLYSALSAKTDAIRPTINDIATSPVLNSTNFPKSTEMPTPSPFTDLANSTNSNSSFAPTNPDTSLDKNNDSTTECNYELECQVCDQKLKTISLLEQHCCRHFMKDLQDQYSSLMDGLKCNICYNSFKQKHSLLLHIGCKHGKINDILRQKNYAALPCPVTNTSSAAMQKQLVQIKKERMESVDMKEEHFSSVRNEMALERPANEASTDLLNETLSVTEGAVAPMPTLDEILKKYKFSAGSGPK